MTISRGRRGIRIFTPAKEQLRENVTRSDHRPLAMELASGFAARRTVRLWDRLHGYLLRFGRRAADNFVRLKLARRRRHQPTPKYEHKITRMLGQRQARALRIEMSAEHSLLLPHDEFAFAELKREGKHYQRVLL